jgi:hypothetical protein
MVRDVAQNVSSGFDPTFASQIFQYPGHRGSYATGDNLERYQSSFPLSAFDIGDVTTVHV